MPGKILFEYAVVRIVPRVEREEFINVGIVLYCAASKFLKFRYQMNEDRITCLCQKTDLGEIENILQAFDRICNGGLGSGPIGLLPPASRFRWLTAKRSTIVQTSPVHPGLCGEPDVALKGLFDQLVK